MNFTNTTHFEECEWEEHFFLSSESLYYFTALAIVTGLAAACGNILVLLAIFKTPNLHEISMFFIGSLAVADASVGVVTVPIYTSATLTWPMLLENDTFEMFLDFLVLQTLMASSFSLIAVSYDRYRAITKPFRYAAVMTMEKCFRGIAVVWVVSTALAGGSFALTGYKTRPKLYLVVIVVAFLIPLAGIAFMYCKIFKEATKHASVIRAQTEATAASSTTENDTDGNEATAQRKILLRNRKAAVSVAIVIGVFAVCWMPNLIIGVFHFVESERNVCEAERMEQIWLVTLPCAFLNSALNPCIYAIRYREFRAAFKGLLKW